ncbi:MAG: hypothetical protein N2D54_00975, partial [Chloroflexota bacterium]
MTFRNKRFDFIKYILIIFLLTLVFAPAQSAKAYPPPFCAGVDLPQAECQALVDLYNSTDGANWGDNTGWGTDITVCSATNWFGVSCNGDPSVTGIALTSNNLAGPIPTSIDDLTNLVTLNINDNSLTGSIPVEITNLTNLTYLNLQFTGLGGNIPTDIGNLNNLTQLLISFNSLDGSLPASIGNMTELLGFYVGDNNLSGPIPSTVGGMSKLIVFSAGANDFTGEIPTQFGNINTLQTLNLSDNLLEGSIPASLGNFPNLRQLYLGSNNLTHSLPPELGNLKTLEIMQIQANNLNWAVPTGFLGQTFMSNLQFHLNSNMCLPNSLSTWYAGLTTTDPDPATVFCDPIFTDGFESGDTTAWSSSVGVSGLDTTDYQTAGVDKLIVNNAASLIDQKGLKVRIVNKNANYVQDTSPAAETRYHAR